MFQFAHSELLFLLLVIPLIVLFYWISNKRRQKLLKEFGDLEIIEQLMPERSKSRPVVKLIFLLSALFFFIFGLAGPQFGTKLRETKRKGVEIIIALDVSNSMLAEDIQPNRLERAKQAISKLVDQLRNDKIGLIVFAGEAFTQLPITTDYVSAKMFLSNITPNIISVPGTAIGSAINLATKSFTPEGKSDKAIIIITDGENHEDDAVGIAAAAREKGIYIHTIGIGLPQGAPIPTESGKNQKNYLKDSEGNIVISKLNEVLLQQIATAGNGIYIRATNTQIGLTTIFDEISKMNKTEYKAKRYSEYEDQFQWPIGIALLLLILEMLVLERRTKLFHKFHFFQVKK